MAERDPPLAVDALADTVLLSSTVAIVGVAREAEDPESADRLLRRVDALEDRLSETHLPPHFLLNSLLAIGVLVREQKADQAVRVLAQVGDILREAIHLPGEDETSLAEEIRLTRKYVEVEQARYGPELRLEVDVPEEALDACVPRMVLQPLVENAIRHGLGPRAGRGTIRVGAELREGALVLTVSDDGVGFRQEAERREAGGEGCGRPGPASGVSTATPASSVSRPVGRARETGRGRWFACPSTSGRSRPGHADGAPRVNVPGPGRVFDSRQPSSRPRGPPAIARAGPPEPNPSPVPTRPRSSSTTGRPTPLRRWAALVVLSVAAGLAACGEAPHGPDVPEFDFTGDTVRIRSLGDTAGAAPEGATLRVVDERRWLHDRAVLDSAALDAGFFLARAPGKVGVEATLSDGEERDLVVLALPDRPSVVGLELPGRPVEPGATATLRGYRLAQLADGGVQVNGYAPEVLGADSASLRFRIPGSTDPDVCRGAGVGVITSDRGRVVGDLRYRVDRAGELALEVGEARALDPGTRCVQLAPRDSGRYALTWLDVDAIENARDGPEDFPRQIEPAPALFTVTVADGVAPEGAEADGSVRTSLTGPLPRPGAEEARGHDVRTPRVSRATDCGERDFRDPCAGFRSRETPWEVGDTFLTDLPDGRSGRARVVQVHGGYLAVALFESDSAAFGSDRREAFRQASRTAMDVAVPRLRSDLTTTYPVTSDGAGQLLVLLSEFTTDTILTGGESALTYFDTDDAGRYPWVVFNLSAPWGGSSAFLATLSHELTHAWARQHLWETPASGGDRHWGLPTIWAEEGVAEFYAHETLRHEADIGVTSNFEGWHDFSASATVQRYSSEARYAVGSLTRGYDHAASFLRHLAVRRTRAGGEGWEEAAAAVARGALEGWYGYDEYGARRTGLTRRMRDVMGPGWSPPEAVLRWATSQALDDRTGSPVHQNRSFRGVSGHYDCSCGWRPRATVVPGTAEEISVTRRYGSTDYFFLQDRGLGGSYQLSWSETDEPVRWMVARYR